MVASARLTLALAALLVAAGASADNHPTGWTEVQTAHVILKTDLSPDDARRAALKVEQSRTALIAAAWAQAKLQPEHIEVVVFAKQSDFLRYFGSNIAGVFTHGQYPPTAYLYGSPEKWEHRETLALEETTSVLKHELAHHLAAFIYRRQPRWFAEGLAQYLETLRVADDGKTAILGEPNLSGFAGYKTYGRSVSEALAWNGKWDAHDATQVSGLYGTSWLLVHWLYNTHPGEFLQYQTLLAKGIDPDKAWKVAFPNLAPKDIDTELHQYADHGDYHYFNINLPAAEGTSTERPLSSADVHALRAAAALTGGANLVHGSGQFGDAKTELAAALMDDPGNVRALRLQLGLVKPEERATLGRRATEAHPEDGLAWLLLAETLRSAPDTWDERAQAYRKAIALLPDNPSAFNNLAWMYLEKGQAQEALPLALSATRMAPWDSSMLDTLAGALAGVGRCSEAVAIQARALDFLPERVSTSVRTVYAARLAEFQKCLDRSSATPPSGVPTAPPR